MANDDVGDMCGYYFQYLCNVPVECRMSIVFTEISEVLRMNMGH